LSEFKVHPTAIVADTAEIGNDVEIGPFSIIGPNVKIGDGTWIDSHVVIEGRTTLGSGNKIWRFASIGTRPQDLKYHGEDAVLIIGDNNMIREYVNMSIGTEHGGMKTVIGSGNLFMVNVHVGHDCIIGDNSIFANGVSLAGHVELENHIFLAGHSAVHQFCKLGSYSMAAAGAIVTQDVPPFVTVQGLRASPNGLNSVLMKRQGFSKEEISLVKNIYKTIYRSGLPFDDAKAKIKELGDSDLVKLFSDFLNSSTRGICR
jgi:UDP-N-acetylglucosamine acyltransferase